jgi:hypothetical protein
MDGEKYEQIKSHLEQYKNDVLNVQEKGQWINIPYGHILPKIFLQKNILPSSYKENIIEMIAKEEINLHIYFHHLNSSQALCLNLFYPLIIERRFDILFKLFHKDVEQIGKCKFEHIECPKEGTNFDFFFETDKSKFFFEIKYTENSFGNTKEDDRHKGKYENIYKEALKAFKNVTKEIFFANYQIFRNLIYNKYGYNIFVVPEFRVDLIEKIKKIKEQYCYDEQKERIIILKIEEVVNAVIEQCENEPDLKNHYELFTAKYFINS